MGEIPSNLKYVESLLVFSSKINPYKHYSAFDTFQEARNRQPNKRREEKKQQEVITEAPESIQQGDTLQHYEQREYNFKPAIKELPQIMLPTDLTLKGIVSLDFPNLTDSDPFMPSKGGLNKNLPQIPEPKMTDDQNPNQNEQNPNANQQTVKTSNNQNAPTTYTPGTMVTFNTFNRGPAPVYKPPENNPSVNNQKANPTNNNATVNTNAPPPPLLNLPPTNTVVNSGAPPPPMLNLSLPKTTGGPPPPPPLINNLASLGVKPDDGNDQKAENTQVQASKGGGEGGRCNIESDYLNF